MYLPILSYKPRITTVSVCHILSAHPSRVSLLWKKWHCHSVPLTATGDVGRGLWHIGIGLGGGKALGAVLDMGGPPPVGQLDQVHGRHDGIVCAGGLVPECLGDGETREAGRSGGRV